MPYANEHSCRLEDPKKYDSFRREACGQKHEGKCIDVIYGMRDKQSAVPLPPWPNWSRKELYGTDSWVIFDDCVWEAKQPSQGEQPAEGAYWTKVSEMQALRYKTDIWTEGDAREHCKERGGSFEPAAKDKDKDSSAMGSLPLVLEYVTGRCWAMQYSTLLTMADVLQRYITGGHLTAEQIAIIAAGKKDKDKDRGFAITPDGRAVIPVAGILAKHSHMVNDISTPRGTSIEQLNEQIDAALADRQVTSILLHIESPGGSIDGLADFAQKVYEAGFIKPVVAYADDIAASAAYWIGSQASAFYANQTAEVGSIGVYTLYLDSSERAKQMGLKFHIIRSGPNKGVGAGGVEITDENLAVIQEAIDEFYEIFLNAVMRGRGGRLDAERLRELADGRTYVAASAAREGLIDGVMNIEQLMAAQVPPVRIMESSIGTAELGKNEDLGDSIMAEAKQKTEAAETDIRREAAAEERRRISAIGDAMGDERFAEVRKEAIEKDLTVEQAKALAFDKAVVILAETTTKMQAEIDKRDKQLSAIAAGGVDISAPETVDGEKTTATGDDGRAETYVAAFDQFVKEGKKLGEARKAAAKKYPLSHKAWKEVQPSHEEK